MDFASSGSIFHNKKSSKTWWKQRNRDGYLRSLILGELTNIARKVNWITERIDWMYKSELGYCYRESETIKYARLRQSY